MSFIRDDPKVFWGEMADEYKKTLEVNMRDCKSCRYDSGTEPTCQQGHYRKREDIGPPVLRTPIQDCHGWKEREKCNCYLNEYTDFVRCKEILAITCKQCGRVIQ